MISIIDAILRLYIWLIIIRVILSWVDIDKRNSFFRPLFILTDPLLKPLSKAIPPLGGIIDMSPMIAIFIIWIILSFLIRAG